MPILINNPKVRNYYNRIRPILKDERASAYFMLIFSLLSLSFFGTFAIRPTLQTITQLQREISDGQDAYRKLQQKNKNLLILQVEHKKIETDLPVIYAGLPSQVDAPTFLLKMRTLATLNNLEIVSLQVAKTPLSGDLESGQKGTVSSPFTLTALGTYTNINNFLVEVARLDRIATFHSIGITPSSTTKSPGSLTLQLTGKIYTLFN